MSIVNSINIREKNLADISKRIDEKLNYDIIGYGKNIEMLREITLKIIEIIEI